MPVSMTETMARRPFNLNAALPQVAQKESYRDERYQNLHRPRKLKFYVNGDRFFKGKKVYITPHRYLHFNDLLNDLTNKLPTTLGLPYGVRQIFTPSSGRRVVDIQDLSDGHSYVCAGFEGYKPIKYGKAALEPWSVSDARGRAFNAQHQKEFDNEYNYSYGQARKGYVGNAFHPGRIIAGRAGDQHHRRIPGPFGQANRNTYLLHSENVPFKPKVVTIIRNAIPGSSKPRSTVKILLNRRSVQSFEQLMNDISEAFGPSWRDDKNKARKLFTTKGREVHGISDFFRDEDVFIAVGKETLTESDLHDIIEEVYHDSPYAKNSMKEFEKHKRKRIAQAQASRDNDADKRDSGFGEGSDGSNRDPDQDYVMSKGRPVEKGKRRLEYPRDMEVHMRLEREREKAAQEEKERSKKQRMKMVDSERRAIEEENRKRRLVPMKGVHEDPFKKMREKEKEEAKKRREEEKHRQEEEEKQRKEHEKQRREHEKEKRDHEKDKKDHEKDKKDHEKEKKEHEKDRKEHEKDKKEQERERKEQEKERREHEKEMREKAEMAARERQMAAEREKADREREKAERRAEKEREKERKEKEREKEREQREKEKEKEKEKEREVETEKEKEKDVEKDSEEKAKNDLVKEGKEVDKKAAKKKSKSRIVRKTKLERQISSEDYVLAKYELGRTLGDGNFAIVRMSKMKSTGAEYAMKVIDKPKLKGKEHMVENEIEIMKDCNHTNIVKLYEEYETADKIYLVMELVKGGDLFDAITQSVKFGEVESAHMVKDLCNALFYLHSRVIVHRDLKPENLLVHRNKDMTITLKLADFGLAMDVKEAIYTVCGTPTYVAPEILSEIGYGMEVDMWAVGVISYILLCGFPPFRSPDRNQTELFEFIKKGEYEFLSPYWDNISASAKDLIEHLLVVDKRRRYTAIDVLCHPWILCGGNMSNAPDPMKLQEMKQTSRRELEATAKMNYESYVRSREARQRTA